MAYRTPTFNIWVEIVSRAGISRGWTICQMRGPTNSFFDLEQTASPNSCVVPWEFLFPKGSDVRTNNSTGAVTADDWDCVLVHGDNRWCFDVQWVGDKAAGFTNEYRLVYASRSSNFTAIKQLPMPRVNKEFVPPPGYTPLPVAAIWAP